jgi:hypothetical protein
VGSSLGGRHARLPAHGTHRLRWWRWAAALAVTVTGLAAPAAAPAQASGSRYAEPPCPKTGVAIVGIKPVEKGVLQVARVASSTAGQPDQWDLKLDTWVCNKTSERYAVDVTVEAVNGSTATPLFELGSGAYRQKYLYRNEFTTFVLDPGEGPVAGYFRPNEQRHVAHEGPLFAYPLPEQLRFTYAIHSLDSEAEQTVTRTFGVAEQAAPGPLGGFFFPLRQSSLPVGARFEQGYHEDWNTHNRYALDIGATRWDTGTESWTPYRADATDHTRADSWLMWDTPVYAMSDGEIISCVRGAPDNVPTYVDGEKLDPAPEQHWRAPGGNFVWIRTGDQTQVYAHFKQLSIPRALCPYEDDLEHKLADPFSEPRSDLRYKIRAGQFLGRIGNSGNTTNPHTHIESIMGTSALYGGPSAEFGFSSDSRPMPFVNVRVQHHNWALDQTSNGWGHITSPHVLPYHTLIAPNDCEVDPSSYAGQAEHLETAVSQFCWPEVFNGRVQAGQRPVHVDAYPSEHGPVVTSVWRPADGTPWALRDGLTGGQLQQAHSEMIHAGYRYLDIDVTTDDGEPRYAALYVRQPGAAQSVRADLSASAFSDVFEERTAAGYRLQDLAVAVVEGEPRYSGVWTMADVPSYVVTDVPESSYQDLFDTQTAAGRKLVSLDAYLLGPTTYLSTVWYGNMQAPWATWADRSASQLDQIESQQLAAGRFARAVTSAGPGASEVASLSVPFAGLWRAAPDTAIASGPRSSSGATATFTFAADDPLATFECQLDGGHWSACGASATFGRLSSGDHVLAVRARDAESVRDATPATRTWTVIT